MFKNKEDIKYGGGFYLSKWYNQLQERKTSPFVIEIGD